MIHAFIVMFSIHACDFTLIDVAPQGSSLELLFKSNCNRLMRF